MKCNANGGNVLIAYKLIMLYLRIKISFNGNDNYMYNPYYKQEHYLFLKYENFVHTSCVNFLTVCLVPKSTERKTIVRNEL